MADNLVYLTSPGNVHKAFEKIKSVPTPERVNQDFVKDKLQIKGGPGNAMASFLKKIGFVKNDSTPSELYIKFRNSATSNKAVADAFRIAYSELYDYNENVHDLSEDDLKGLIIQVTGCAEDARSLSLTLSTIKALKKHADFSDGDTSVESDDNKGDQENSIIPNFPESSSNEQMGLNLSYTINLNLPATSDIAVFNAIFKSLRENILKK